MEKDWRAAKLTSAFMPTILLGAAAAPRTKPPGSSSSFEMVFMLYSWEDDRPQFYIPIPLQVIDHYSKLFFCDEKTTLCF